MGDGDDQGGDGIESGESEEDSDCENEPGNYPTPQSMAEQADSEVSSDSSPAATLLEPSIEPEPSPKPIPSESSSSQAKTPSSTSSESSQPP